MACLVQNGTTSNTHLPVHENLSKKRKLASPNHFKNKRVQRIHDTSTSPPWTPLYPASRLEQEAIQYIHKFYCKDCQMDQQAAERAKAAATSGEDAEFSSTQQQQQQSHSTLPEVKQEPSSPMSPQQMTDEASLMITLDKNKESLKRKLMMRRSLNELVDQGILPSPKTPLAFMEQRKSLERAKIGDSLRFKISHRPDRQQLVQQHILEDTNIDPSLHERQRLLKKARLADSLNDKLSHRPGVLELVQGNIIQADNKLTQLIREGSLSFDTANEVEECSNDSTYDDGKSSDEALSPDMTDDSNLSDISSPPVIPPAPELPTSFTKSLPFSAQIQFHQDSKVTLPQTTQQFTIPHQTISSGGLGATAFVSQRNNVTVSTINNSKVRPKKAKPKPQPKAKVIKFHEYKGPPNIVKSSQPVPSPAAMTTGTIGNTANVVTGESPHSDTPYHILLQQQQLFLQWQLEFNQKNLNATTVLVPAQKDGQATFQTLTSGVGSSVVTSVTDSAAMSVTTQTTPQTVFTMTPTNQHAQPQAQIQQIRISSPVMTQIKQEPQLGQPQPQLNPNITPVVTQKTQVKKPTVNIVAGPAKQYTSLEEMKVAELKAELKKRNLTVSGPKPQLIERLKPYADAILKCPSEKSPGSVTSPGSSVLSPTGSILSSRSVTSPQSFSVMSPLGSVTSPPGSVMNPKTVVMSIQGSSSGMGTPGTLPVVVTTFTGSFSQPGSVQSYIGSLTSPGSVANSPTLSGTSQSGSVFSRPGSVMSPLGSVIDETLCNNADSPLASIQSMQSAVSVSNMTMMPDDLSNPFSPPQSPLFDNMMTPLSPDLMDIPVQSPGEFKPANARIGFQLKNSQNISNTQCQPNQNSIVNTAMEQSRPPSVLSLAPSEADKNEAAMDIDLDLTQSFGNGGLTAMNVASVAQHVSPPPQASLPNFSNISATNPNVIKAQQDNQQQRLNQIQAQLRILQEKQIINQKQHMQANPSASQMSQEDLLKQQQDKIEKLQSQLEESQLQLKLQQLQHQQLQTQQKQLQQLQQQALQQQAAQTQLEQQQQQMQQSMQQQQHVQQQNVQQQQQPIPTSTQQQQQQQQAIQAHVNGQLAQPMPAQSPQTVVPAQGTVPAQGHVHKQIQLPAHQQLQGQPQTVVQGQPPLAVQIPTSSPIILQTQTTVAQTAPNVTQPQQKSPLHGQQKQVPSTAPQVIFSVPSLPNGSKAPTLANLPPNMKQIQIPAHLLHAFQNSQGVPAVIVTQNTKTGMSKKKAPSLEFIKNQAINQTLNLGGGRSLIAVSTATGGAQQFIIATPPSVQKTGNNTQQTSTAAQPLNGLTQPAVQKMATSLPTSPVEGSQRPVARTSSNPFFLPMKEPPKYEEAVKNKPTKTTDGDNVEKSQTMDDVLEILIRTGELPASAAQEPPPTPKTATQATVVPTVSVTHSSMASVASSQLSPQPVVFSTPTHNVQSLATMSSSPNSQFSDMKGNIESMYVPMEGLISASAFSSGIKPEVKLEPCQTQTSIGTLNAPEVTSENSNDLFDLSDVINTDLNAMDWTPDQTFGDLDLTEMANTGSAMDMMTSEQSYLSIPNVQSPQRSIHGSEPDLANLGLSDMDTNSNMQIDVPDWLDVIMPNTGLTPISANAPVSFPADPILTPQTQREVLDLFNFDESDLNTPSDFNSTSAWDKLTETTTH